jgi:hypothetical protein
MASNQRPDAAGSLEAAFHAEMEAIYTTVGAELGYWASRYLQSIRRKGGLRTAQDLLKPKRSKDIASGLRSLIDAGHPEFTVEYLVLQPEYANLFTAAELSEAQRRLQRHSGTATADDHEAAALALSKGAVWSRAEVEATVASYFAMLEAGLRGEDVNKTQYRKRLIPLLNGRTPGAVERKHQNISAILIDERVPYISGYKPLGNYQLLLRQVVLEQLTQRRDLRARIVQEVSRVPPIPERAALDSVFAPVPPPRMDAKQGRIKRAPTQHAPTDYLAMEARNSALGLAGEEFVVRLEQARLESAGKGQLAAGVTHVSVERGDGLGYDVLSFEEDSRERLIEVKTTKFGEYTPFYVSQNELEVSRDCADRYQLYRVYNFGPTARLFKLSGALDSSFRLDAATYVARV